MERDLLQRLIEARDENGQHLSTESLLVSTISDCCYTATYNWHSQTKVKIAIGYFRKTVKLTTRTFILANGGDRSPCLGSVVKYVMVISNLVSHQLVRIAFVSYERVHTSNSNMAQYREIASNSDKSDHSIEFLARFWVIHGLKGQIRYFCTDLGTVVFFVL